MTTKAKKILSEMVAKYGYLKETTGYDVEMALKVHGEELLEDIAIRMLDGGYPVDAISRITGVSESEVLRLKNNRSLLTQTLKYPKITV